MKILILFYALSMGSGGMPSDSLTLQQCYDWARQHYPTVESIEIQQKISDINTKVVQSTAYPQLTVSGRASYQSEVPEIAIPGASSISKDQYDLSVNFSQNLYNGGRTEIMKDLEQVKGERTIHEIETEFHQLKAQINQVYFGLLLSRKQRENLRLLTENLEERLSSIKSKVENGVLLPSHKYVMEAELLKIKQDSAQVSSNIKAGFDVLSELIGKDLDHSTELTIPDAGKVANQKAAVRPEIKAFESSRMLLEKQADLSDAGKYPVLSVFGSAGYGRPGYDFLNDDFHNYYMVGLRLNWNLWDFLNAGEKRTSLEMQQQQVNRKKDAFQTQLNTNLQKVKEEIQSIREYIQHDREIISLREKVVKEKASQLDNGVLTSTEYVTELYHAHQARLSLSTNQIKLARARVEYLNLLGADLRDLNTNGGN